MNAPGLLLLCALLAACGGGAPLPEDCVPAGAHGPLEAGQIWCDVRPVPRVDCSVPGLCG